VGLFGPQCGTPTPEWRHKARATWATPWNTDLALTWRYIAKVENEGTSSQPLLFAGVGGVPATDKELKAMNYFDIAAAWTINKTFTLRGGINNIFDQDPPFLTSDSICKCNSFAGGGYDFIGRFYYTRIQIKM
jgi:outer membrane receptor protein involved in Fe transport